MTAPVLHLPRLATVEHVAGLLSLHPRTVRELCRTGDLIVYRLGRAVRIDLASVEAHLCRNRVAIPQPVASPKPPPSAAPTSTAAARFGTPAAAPSGAKASPSTPATQPKPANDSAPSLPAPDPMALDPWDVLRPSRRRRS